MRSQSQAVVAVLALLALPLAACTKKSQEASTETAAATAPANGLKIEEITVGTGAEAVSGKQIKVHYTGTLTNGTKFDSSLDHGQPFQFMLGGGQVIQGWDQGFTGMKVGGKRKLTIPPELGYGARESGPIPPNSTLIFEVELLEVN